MQLFIYHTPELTPESPMPDCAVVIDVLRATSTIITALQAGAEAVQVFADIAPLLAASAAWPAGQRLLAGERGGLKVEGFDLGNSPFDCTPAVVQGRRLFMTTTNGTRALQRVQAAPQVFAAALLNRRAVVDRLLALRPATVWVVCGGWENHFSLEDTVCAGALVAGVLEATAADLPTVAGNDEAVAAVALFRQWQNQLESLLPLATHGQRLLHLGCTEDLSYCARLDGSAVVPRQIETGVFRDA